MNARPLKLAVVLLAAASLAGVSLAGCASAPPKTAAVDKPEPKPMTPIEQYKIKVAQSPEQIALAIHPKGLSPNQQTALADFVSRWRDNGGGEIVVKAPLGTPEPKIARRTGEAMLAFLQHLGVPSDRLRLVGYYPVPGERPPVLASFRRYEALGPDCSQGWSNLAATKDNNPQPHFGCAETANIAAMAANPRDFVTPAAVDPADDSRREVVINAYRKGAVTSASKDDQASSALAQ